MGTLTTGIVGFVVPARSRWSLGPNMYYAMSCHPQCVRMSFNMQLFDNTLQSLGCLRPCPVHVQPPCADGTEEQRRDVLWLHHVSDPGHGQLRYNAFTCSRRATCVSLCCCGGDYTSHVQVYALLLW